MENIERSLMCDNGSMVFEGDRARITFRNHEGTRSYKSGYIDLIAKKGVIFTNGRFIKSSDIIGVERLYNPNGSQISDPVNHPSHYKSETGLEAIDAIEAFTFDLKGIEAVDTGNILKYICRWKKKNGLQDLKKAQWYLNHLINHVENLEKENEENE